MDTDRTSAGAPDIDAAALDAYSRAVTTVAAQILPSVAALAVRTPRGGGAGSAVTFTTDGFLLTSAHVVAGAARGDATFADGAEARFDVVGTDPLSDLAVLRVRAPGRRPPRSATRTSFASANSSSPSAIRWAWPAR